MTEGKTDFQIDSVTVYDGSSEKVISSESEICITYVYKSDVESKKAVEFLHDGFDGVFHVRFKEKNTGKQIDYYNIPLVEPAILRFHEQDGYTYVTGWDEYGNQLSNMEYYKVRTYDEPVTRKIISDGRDVFINRSKKVGIGYDYEYSYPQNINGIAYRDTAKSSYRIASYKRYPTIDILCEYAEFTGNFTGYMRRSVQKDGCWGNWVRISEDSYWKAVRSYTSSAEFILPKYNNTPANRNKYI